MAEHRESISQRQDSETGEEERFSSSCIGQFAGYDCDADHNDLGDNDSSGNLPRRLTFFCPE